MYISGSGLTIFKSCPCKFRWHVKREQKPMKGEKSMKKSELKTGMIVVLRNDRKARVMLNTIRGGIVQYINSAKRVTGFDHLDYWDMNLAFVYGSGITFFTDKKKDIMCVQKPNGVGQDSFYLTIWTRPVVHTLRLDEGEPVELSEKTYVSMKRTFKFEEQGS